MFGRGISIGVSSPMTGLYLISDTSGHQRTWAPFGLPVKQKEENKGERRMTRNVLVVGEKPGSH